MSIFPVILSVWITHESTCLVSSLPSWLLEVIVETSNGPMAVLPLIVITVTVVVFFYYYYYLDGSSLDTMQFEESLDASTKIKILFKDTT